MDFNLSTFELCIVREKELKYNLDTQFNNPDKIYELAKKELKLHQFPEEHVIMLTLDPQCRGTGVFTISKGTANMSLIHPREVFKRALLQNTSRIVLIHNHPSGDPAPSNSDIEVTKNLIHAGKILQVEILDHIIITDSGYVSLKEKGHM